MTMKDIKLAVAAAAVAAVLVSATTAKAEQNSCTAPIVLGTTISETGSASTLTAGWKKMTEVFAEQINEAGGIFIKSCHRKLPLQFVIYDDESNPSTAVSLYEKMATGDHVDFFVGPDWSFVGIPVAAVAEAHKIPIVLANVSTPSAYKRGFKYMFGTPAPTVPLWSQNYLDMITNMSPKPKSAFFVTQDNPVTKAITAVWSKKFAAAGLKVVGEETFPNGLKNFIPIILRIRASHPDIIYISSFDNPSVPLVEQMRRMHVHAMDVHHIMLSYSLERQTGNEIDGMTGELPWYPGVKGPYSDFIDSVLKQAGVNVFSDIFTDARINSYLVMIQAIEKAGVVNREKVREALYKGTFKTPAGDITFDADGYPDTGGLTIQMQNGKVVVVWPPDRATGKVIWPSPTWQK